MRHSCLANRRWRRWIVAVLLVQAVYLYLVWNRMDDLFDLAEDFPQQRPINETAEELDARRYLEALVKVAGNKFAALNVQEGGWLHQNRWWLFSAYEDRRPNSLYSVLRTSIQIIASTYHVVAEDERWYCHVVNRYDQTLRVRAHFRLIWQRAWDPRLTFYNPYLITCGLPNDFDVSGGAAVSLKGKRCPNENTTFVPVTLVPQPQRAEEGPPRIAVCVKGLDFFEEKRRELAEWFLLQFALGADSITTYVYHVPSETRKLLETIAMDYTMTIVDLTLPGNVTNEPAERHAYIWGNYPQKRRNELIPYNDCFYRYSHTHDYVLLVDTDEVVVPLRHSNWSAMVDEFTAGFRRNATSLSVRNVFKFPADGEPAGLVGRRFRAADVQDAGVSGKSFISTRTAATVFNHFALHRQHGDVQRTAHLPADWALKLHFKTDCPADYKQKCADLKAKRVPDDSLDRWRADILKKVVEYVPEETGME
ncbi:Glycosyltransferase family 92 protein [Aphelenchoides fujianensis]|nr:Glycosyltransferase family 92 protein [Aphelenchoides fujianensis]